MRRMLRILLNAGTVLSLVLCVATAGLWVRSYQVGDLYHRTREETLDDREYVARSAFIESGRGTLGVTVTAITVPAATVRAAGYVPVAIGPSRVTQCRPPVGVVARWQLDRRPLRPGSWAWTRAGVLVEDRREDTMYTPANRINFVAKMRQRSIVLPCRLVVALTALAPAWAAVRYMRRRKVRPGCCVHCGYDLRATPERCPECGNALVAAATPAREGKGETEGV